MTQPIQVDNIIDHEDVKNIVKDVSALMSTVTTLQRDVEALTSLISELETSVAAVTSHIENGPAKPSTSMLTASTTSKPAGAGANKKRDRSRAPILSKPLTPQEQEDLDAVYDTLLVFCKEKAIVNFTSEQLWDWLRSYPDFDFKNEAGDPIPRDVVERAYNAKESGEFDILQVARVLGKVESRSIRDKTPSFVVKRVGQAGKRHWTFQPLSDTHGVIHATFTMPEVARELKELLAVDSFTPEDVVTQMAIAFDEEKFPYLARLKLNPTYRTSTAPGKPMALQAVKKALSKDVRLYYQEAHNPGVFKFRT